MNPVNLLEPLKQGNTTLAKVVNVSDYIGHIFPIFLAACVALAIVYIAWGGLAHMLSNVPGIKTEGKKRITNALWGLVIALAAWVILQTINPKIVNDSSNKVLHPTTNGQL